MRLERFLEKATYYIVALAAVFVVLGSIAEPKIVRDVSVQKTFLIALCYGLLTVCIIMLSLKLSENMLKKMVYAGIIIAFMVQLVIVFQMQLVPKVDLSHIYETSVKMLETDSVKITNKKYYSFNTNNIPVQIVVYWVFRIAKVLGVEYRIAGGVFNIILLCAMYSCVFAILKRITTMRTAFVCMFVLLTNPVFYAYASYYYTDTVSLGITMSGIYLMFRAYEAIKMWKKTALYVLAGLLMGLAVCIRVTSIFILLAIMVWILVSRNWKKLLQWGVPTLTGMILFSILWQGIYQYHVDFDTSESAITVEHFIMMGSTGDGMYNWDDVLFTKSFATHEERAENNRRVWLQRVRENGLLGNLKLIIKKEEIVWGIGASGYSQYVENVVEQTPCYDWMVGEKSGLFRAYMQAYNIVLFALILLGTVTMISKKKSNPYMWIIGIYWCGALVFYIFWEAHPRYSVSIVPLLTMLIVPWLESRSR